jgi:hypothetical protein
MDQLAQIITPTWDLLVKSIAVIGVAGALPMVIMAITRVFRGAVE